MRRRLALALVAALALLVLLVAWLGESRARGRAASTGAAPAHVADAPAALLAVPASVPDEPERTPIAAEPAREGAIRGRATPVELGPREALLQVRVVALETKQPVAGARVRLETLAGASLATTASEHASGTWRESLVCDGEGRADFRVPCDEPLVLHAQPELAPGRSARLRVRPVAAGQYRTAIVGVFTEPDRTWCARVVDGATGAPIAGARVGLASGFGASLFQSWSAADGRVCLELRADHARSILVEADGYGPVAGPLDAGAREPAEAQVVELFGLASLDVLVRGADGRAVVGASVELRSLPVAGPWPGSPADAFAAEARTEIQGHVFLGDVPAGRRLMLAVTGERLLRAEELVLASGEHRRVVCVVEDPAAVAGVVLDPAGLPVAGLELCLVPVRGLRGQIDLGLPEPLVLQASSDDEGRFRFDSVPAGAWTVGARSPVPGTRRLVEIDGGIRLQTGPEEDVETPSLAVVQQELELRGGEQVEVQLRALRAPRTIDPRPGR